MTWLSSNLLMLLRSGMKRKGVAPLVAVFLGVGVFLTLAGLAIMAESVWGAADDILVVAGLGFTLVGGVGWYVDR